MKRLAVTAIDLDDLDPLPPGGPAAGAATVPAGATLKDALAALLVSDAAVVVVVGDDGPLGALTPDRLHAALRRQRPPSDLRSAGRPR